MKKFSRGQKVCSHDEEVTQRKTYCYQSSTALVFLYKQIFLLFADLTKTFLIFEISTVKLLKNYSDILDGHDLIWKKKTIHVVVNYFFQLSRKCGSFIQGSVYLLQQKYYCSNYGQREKGNTVNTCSYSRNGTVIYFCMRCICDCLNASQVLLCSASDFVG